MALRRRPRDDDSARADRLHRRSLLARGPPRRAARAARLPADRLPRLPPGAAAGRAAGHSGRPGDGHTRRPAHARVRPAEHLGKDALGMYRVGPHGDGRRVEIMAAALRVLARLGDFEFDERLDVWASIAEHGNALSDDTPAECRASAAVLLA